MAATGHPRCPTLALLSAAPLLHGVEKLLLGVDTELGKDCLAVGVGGVARDAQLLADEADIATPHQQREHLGLAGREAVLGRNLAAALVERFRREAEELMRQ